MEDINWGAGYVSPHQIPDPYGDFYGSQHSKWYQARERYATSTPGDDYDKVRADHMETMLAQVTATNPPYRTLKQISYQKGSDVIAAPPWRFWFALAMLCIIITSVIMTAIALLP
jgi:hypothetical protein